MPTTEQGFLTTDDRPTTTDNRMTNRVLSILFIILCFEIGILLFFFPWISFWSKNFFVHHYSSVALIARNYFVRGGISGIGLADIGLAIYEIGRLRRRRRSLVARPSR